MPCPPFKLDARKGQHPMLGLSMIDGYLAALVVSPHFIPSEDWLRPIVGDDIAWALDGSIEKVTGRVVNEAFAEEQPTLQLFPLISLARFSSLNGGSAMRAW